MKWGTITGSLLVAGALLLATGCPSVVPNLPFDQVQFSGRDTEGIFRGEKYLMRYDETGHQVSVNQARKNYRIQSDDQSEILNVTVRNEVALKKMVFCNIYFVSGNEIIDEGLIFRVIKLDYGTSPTKVWMWNDSEKIGIVMPMP